jgi:hypothetical protein
MLIGGEAVGASVALRLFAENLEPDVLSLQLGVQATFAYRTGDCVSPRSGTRRRQGTWQLESTLPEDRPLEEHIRAVLAKIRCSPEDWEMATTGMSRDLFCGVFVESQSSGVSLGAATLQEVAKRGLSLEFDLTVRNKSEDS